MNHKKIRMLGIKPERIRELINQIDMQQINSIKDLINNGEVSCHQI